MLRPSEHRVPLGIAGSVVSLGIAVIYLVVVPEEATRAEGVVELVLRFGHSLCWLLLAIAGAAWAARAPRPLVVWSARGALAAYLAFLVTLLVVRAGAG